jgi:hypothetical protein
MIGMLANTFLPGLARVDGFMYLAWPLSRQ